MYARRPEQPKSSMLVLGCCTDGSRAPLVCWHGYFSEGCRVGEAANPRLAGDGDQFFNCEDCTDGVEYVTATFLVPPAPDDTYQRFLHPDGASMAHDPSMDAGLTAAGLHLHGAACSTPAFIASRRFAGSRVGMVFEIGQPLLEYYLDTPPVLEFAPLLCPLHGLPRARCEPPMLLFGEESATVGTPSHRRCRCRCRRARRRCRHGPLSCTPTLDNSGEC